MPIAPVPPVPPAPVPVLPAGTAVRFDDGVAARLQAALEDLADEAVGHARSLAHHADVAGVDWAGHSRAWFEDRLHQALRDGRAAAATARTEAGEVARARAWAAAETERRLDEARRFAEAEAARLAELAASAAA